MFVSRTVSKWQKEHPETRNPMRFFLYASKPHKRVAVIAISAVVVAGIFSASVSYVFKLVVDAAVALPESGSYEDLLFASMTVIFVLAGGKAFWRISGLSGARWATGARATARHALTRYVTLHSRSYFSDHFAGAIATKIAQAGTGMLDAVELFLWEFLELVVVALASFVIAFTVSPIIAFIFFGWMAAVVILNAYFARKRVPLSAYSHKLESGLTGQTVDLLSNIAAMQDYARRPYEIERLEGAIDKRRKAGLRNWYYGETVLILNNILQTLFGATMVLAALWLLQQGAISLGDIVLTLTVIFRIEGHLQTLGQNLNRISNVWGEVEESLREVIEPHEIADKPKAPDLLAERGEIRFDHVTFGYEDAQIFQELNLTIPAGQRVGLVGRSGAGKSTIVRLVLRHHDLVSGRILIDGADVAKVTQESLRSSISLVPQEPLLFHRSIAENIAYGKPEASMEEIQRAAELAQAEGFIERLPEGYESLVGERGIKLSGGERQRVAIARAILKDAKILLLDEATSALDSESEVEIQKALHALMEGKTVIAIAHRLSTLREMDRIIVIDQGEIVEDGSHDELEKKGGVYAELWSHQAGGFLQDE